MNRKIFNKMLASLILMSIMFANMFAFGEVFALNLNLENQNTTANISSVNFDAYFKDQNGNKIHSIKADINDTVNLYLFGKVSEGYLKDIKVTLDNANYEIVKDKIVYGDIENVTSNTVTINRIRRNEELEVCIPVKAITSDYISVNMFNKQNDIKMEGNLVNNDSKTVSVNKTVFTNVEWSAEVKASLSQEIIKYIPFENENSKGIILQTRIKAGIENNLLPTEKLEIVTDIPYINQMKPSKVYVMADSTMSTNGKDGLEFNESNWNIKDNKIYINVENSIQENNVSWKKECQDEYILTFIYDSKAFTKDNVLLNIKTDAKIKAFTIEKEATEKIEKQIELNEQLGKIINIAIDNTNINKGYMYTKYNTEYVDKWTLDIANFEEIDSISLNEKEVKFNDVNEKTFLTNEIYKNTKINKLNFEKMLGKDGYIKIYNDNKLLYTIDKTLESEDGYYVINYEKEIKDIRIETSKILSVGKLEIINTKLIPKDNYDEKDIKEFNLVSKEIEMTTKLNEKNSTKIEGIFTKNLEEPKTDIELILSDNKLSTLTESQNINLMVMLKNSKVQCKLFENPVIKIKLPEYIENVKLNDETKLLFTDELKINRTVYDKAGNEIIIELKGSQTKYNDILVTEGTIISLNIDVELKDKTPIIQDNIKLEVTNKEDVVTTSANIWYTIPSKNEEELKEEQEAAKEAKNGLTNIKNNNNIDNNKENIENKENETKITSNNNMLPENNLKANTEVTNIEKADLKVTITNDLKEGAAVKEGGIINYTVSVTNTGSKTLENVMVEANIPAGTTYREFVKGTNYSIDEYIENPNRTVYTVVHDVIKPGKTAEIKYQVIVNENKNNLDSVIAGATVKVAGYQNTVSNKIENKITKGMFNIDLITETHSDETFIKGSEIKYIGYLQNVTSQDSSNVMITAKIPNGVDFKDAYFAVKMDNDGKEAEYNEELKTVTWKINKVEANSKVEVQLLATVNGNANEIKNVFNVSTDDGYSCTSNEIVRYVDKSNLSIKQYSNINDEFINVGDIINYYITVKNEGTKIAENVRVIDTLPTGLENVTLKYKHGGQESDPVECKNKEITLSGFEINPGETLNITITAKVSELPSDAKGTLTYTNKVTAEATEIPLIEANSITYKLKVISKKEKNDTIDISGIAWIDSSRNGARDDGEEILKGIEVRLITKDERVVAKTRTDKKGEYIFENVSKGEYLVEFIYDTNKYTMTTYKAKDVVEAKNSDVALEKNDFIDGNITKFGVTDVVTVDGSSVYNIDLGLQVKTVFDLSLSKTISKVTVKNSKETKTYSYNNKTLAKVELASKDVNDTTIIIEYTFIVKNEGTVSGYAKSIVDYLPKDLKFATDLNKDWYIGNDGNIYTNAIQNVIINPGETKEIKLIVTKQMNDKNLGTINNSAEIAESYNEYGIDDIDSTHGNKSSKEDDYASADMLISLNTGTIIMYTGLGITLIAIIAVAVYMIKKNILIEV